MTEWSAQPGKRAEPEEATTTMATKQTYERLTAEELAAMSELLHSLDPAQWDAPSLCEGWKVRHVVGHVCLGSSISPLSMPVRLIPFGFNVPKASSVMSYRYGDEHTREQMLDTWDRVVRVGKPGLSKLVPASEFFADKLIHHQDIRRPLGLAREIPREHLTTALDALGEIGGFMQTKKVVKGLRLVATDIDYSVGPAANGAPEVRGPAESIVLSVSGRPLDLGRLEGDGVNLLRQRISA